MSHKAEVVKVVEVADGILAVHARCCGDVSTESVLTLNELHRDEAAIDADVAAHLAKLEKLHAARDYAKAHIQRLCPKSQ